MSESSLHASLKTWYAQQGDRIEALVDGYLIDLVRDDLLIEIQTRNFYALKPKLKNLIESHPIRLVYPIPLERWIIRMPAQGEEPIGRRKSPKRGRPEDLFRELIRFPGLVTHPNFSLEVLYIHEDEIRYNDGRGSWRRKGWHTTDHRLIKVITRQVYQTTLDYYQFLPPALPARFTSRQLARAIQSPTDLAQKMVYCLRAMNILETSGKQNRSQLYSIRPANMPKIQPGD